MKPSAVLARSRERIRALVIEHGVSNPRVFGSVLRSEDVDGSDLDILVDPTAHTSLLDIAKLQMRLESELGIHVDVLTPKALPLSFRNQVIAHAQPV
jgi:predicted nucleotidyltransferase